MGARHVGKRKKMGYGKGSHSKAKGKKKRKKNNHGIKLLTLAHSCAIFTD